MSDDDHSVLEDVAAARERLGAIDTGAVDDTTAARLLNAREQLDNILLDATAGEIVDVARSRERSEDERAEQVNGRGGGGEPSA